MSELRERPLRVFVSGVASLSHLLHVRAYLRARAEEPSTGALTVVDLGTSRFLGLARVSASDVRSRLLVGQGTSYEHVGDHSGWRGSAGEELVYVAVGAPGLKAWVRLHLANRRVVRCVVVDEGLGSYGDWRTRWSASRREGRRSRALVRAASVALMRRVPCERRPMYSATADGWRVDERVAAEFRAGVAVADAGPAAGRRVVLVSQPWVELGVMEQARYGQILGQVQDACVRSGSSLLVCPHPVEDRARYAGTRLREASGPVELDPQVVSASVVVGFSSTALINLAAVHGARVVRVVVPELEALDRGMSARQRALLEAFVPVALRPEQLADHLSALPPPADPG